MPFASDKQRKFLFEKKPELAKKFAMDRAPAKIKKPAKMKRADFKALGDYLDLRRKNY